MSKVIKQSATDNEYYFAEFAHWGITNKEPFWARVENASGCTRFKSYPEALEAAKWCVENIPNNWATGAYRVLKATSHEEYKVEELEVFK